MEKLIKTFKGFSGSDVFLIQKNDLILIKKVNNIDRNYKQLNYLFNLGFSVPKIYKKQDNLLEMEYVEGLDLKTYMINHGIEGLFDFIIKTIDKFKQNQIDKDYTQIYYDKLKWLDETNELPFTKEQLIQRLPKILPSSIYHGDLTLENIIFSNKNKFYMIDAITTEYDSWVFDLCKLRQDLSCYWFIRDNLEENNLKVYSNLLFKKIALRYPIINDDNLLILILLRVFPYLIKNTKEYFYILNEVKKLWK